MGPLIYIIHCNDFPASSEDGESVMYADDDTDNVHDKNPIELKRKIQQEAEISASWIKDNRLVCSGEKTKLLIIGTTELKRTLRTDNIMEINVCGERVMETKSEKLLGLIVNGEMTWKEYLYGEKWRTKKEDNFIGLIPKLAKRVGLLKQMRNKMDDKTFNMVSNGIFNSLLIYY